MKFTQLKVGHDYLVSQNRNWIEAGGDRLRFTGELVKERRLVACHGERDVVIAAIMAVVGDDGEQVDAPHIYASAAAIVAEMGRRGMIVVPAQEAQVGGLFMEPSCPAPIVAEHHP